MSESCAHSISGVSRCAHITTYSPTRICFIAEITTSSSSICHVSSFRVRKLPVGFIPGWLMRDIEVISYC